VLKPVEMKKIRIYVHSDYIDRVLHKLGEIGKLHIIDIEESLDEFNDKLQTVEASDKLFKVSSLLSRINSLIDTLKIHGGPKTKVNAKTEFMDEQLNQINNNVDKIEEETQRLLTQLSETEKAKIPSEEVRRKTEQIKLELRNLADKNGSTLLVHKEILEIEMKIEEAKTLMGKTKHTHVFEGWIPETDAENTLGVIKSVSENCCSIDHLKAESDHKESEKPPTLLKNPRFVGVFESLTKAFGMPNYYEIDPTIFWLISFPIIFGLMFGDIAHGVLLFLAGAAFLFIKRKGIELGGTLGQLAKYPINGAPLLIMCGLSSTVAGFLYGDILGSEELYKALTGLEHPIWFSPWHQPMTLLKYSIYIAMIHITFGLILSLVNHIKAKEYKDALVGPIIWLWLYWSFSILILQFKWNAISGILNPSSLGSYVIFHPFIPFIAMIAARTAIHKGEGMTESLESFLSSISHTVSYARILALKMVGSAFTSLFPFSLTLGGFAAFVGGTIFIMILEPLLCSLHTLRLHWVEWFLKFYQGTGFTYQPFIFFRKFTIPA